MRIYMAMLLLVGSLAPACEVSPEPLEDHGLEWTTYESETGFFIDHPSVVEAIPEGAGVAFAYKGTPVRVIFTDSATAADHGLWVRSDPVEEIELAGRPGQKYVYNHWDGPVYVRTVAFVVPYRDQWLAVEFRTPDELTSVQQRMLASFGFAP